MKNTVRIEQSALDWMEANLDDFIDPLTGEVDRTTMAEECCSHFDAFEFGWKNEAQVPEEFFDWAHRVAEAYEEEANQAPEPGTQEYHDWLTNELGDVPPGVGV